MYTNQKIIPSKDLKCVKCHPYTAIKNKMSTWEFFQLKYDKSAPFDHFTYKNQKLYVKQGGLKTLLPCVEKCFFG